MTHGFHHPKFLVETDWLAQRLEDPAVRVLDCTTHLPPLPDNSYYTVRPGKDDFLRAHIPGAAFVDMDRDVADTASAFHFMLPSSAQFAEAMSVLGITDETLVVCYSTANHWWATRMWWILRVFGHERAAVLNGGFQKWSREGRAVEHGTGKAYARTQYTPRPARRDMIASKDDVLTAIGASETCIVNALRPEQHSGTGGVNYGRRGHIPGSINLPAVETVNSENVYKSPDELRHMFVDALAKPAVITYCGGGIAASAATFVLTMLGHENIRLYDASLSEWARDPALPMQL